MNDCSTPRRWTTCSTPRRAASCRSPTTAGYCWSTPRGSTRSVTSLRAAGPPRRDHLPVAGRHLLPDALLPLLKLPRRGGGGLPLAAGEGRGGRSRAGQRGAPRARGGRSSTTASWCRFGSATSTRTRFSGQEARGKRPPRQGRIPRRRLARDSHAPDVDPRVGAHVEDRQTSRGHGGARARHHRAERGIAETS